MKTKLESIRAVALACAYSMLGLMLFKSSAFSSVPSGEQKGHGAAAEQGETAAQLRLGVCCELGKDVLQDHTETVRLTRSATRQGEGGHGEGHAGGSRGWYRDSAEEGNMFGEYRPALCYFTGKGVVQDMQEAVKLIQSASRKGCLSAQTVLGSSYLTRYGVEKDEELGLKLIRDAAQKDDPTAVKILAGILRIQTNKDCGGWVRNRAGLRHTTQFNLT